MLGGFFMFVNIENMEKPKCAEIFWQMQKQFRLTTMDKIPLVWHQIQKNGKIENLPWSGRRPPFLNNNEKNVLVNEVIKKQHAPLHEVINTLYLCYNFRNIPIAISSCSSWVNGRFCGLSAGQCTNPHFKSN